jgi:integrase
MAKRSYGPGRIFKHKDSPFWYASFSVRGKEVRKSTGVPYERIEGEDGKWRPKPGSNVNERKAGEVLRKMIEDARTDAGFGHLTLDKLLKGVENDYKLNRLKSKRVLAYRSQHLRDFFGANCRAGAINTARLREYAGQRQKEGASNGSINREFSLLRRGFRLASETIGSIPIFPMLKEADPRKGFFELEEHTKVVAALPEPHNRIWEVLHDTGWRTEDVLARQKSHVDLEHGWLNIDPGETKNDDGRRFPLTPKLRETIQAQLKWSHAIEIKLGMIIPSLWHHENGEPITYQHFYETWRPIVPSHRIAHDLRRTASRDFNRLGVPNITAMKLTGHKTESVYRRYAIVDEKALREAAEVLAGRQAEPSGSVAGAVSSIGKAAKSIRHQGTGKKTEKRLPA